MLESATSIVLIEKMSLVASAGLGMSGGYPVLLARSNLLPRWLLRKRWPRILESLSQIQR
jgi:hypothetical protein